MKTEVEFHNYGEVSNLAIVKIFGNEVIFNDLKDFYEHPEDFSELNYI
jgi:hypothetical protein